MFHAHICLTLVYSLRRYSAFLDNTKTYETRLGQTLKDNGIKKVYVVGIATDFCVYHTAKDAKMLGYETFVVEVRNRHNSRM